MACGSVARVVRTSCPAVSQICIVYVSPSMDRSLFRNSTPIVWKDCASNSLFTNRFIKLDFPTPPFPKITTLSRLFVPYQEKRQPERGHQLANPFRSRVRCGGAAGEQGVFASKGRHRGLGAYRHRGHPTPHCPERTEIEFFVSLFLFCLLDEKEFPNHTPSDDMGEDAGEVTEVGGTAACVRGRTGCPRAELNPTRPAPLSFVRTLTTTI